MFWLLLEESCSFLTGLPFWWLCSFCLGTLLQVGSFGLPRPQLTIVLQCLQRFNSLDSLWLLQVLWFRGGKASSMDIATESVDIVWFLLLWTKWTNEEWTMLESAELQRPGKAFVFSYGKVKDNASPQVRVSSVSMICSTAHWLQSSTKWTLSLQSLSGSILPMVFSQRALDLDNLGHAGTIRFTCWQNLQ